MKIVNELPPNIGQITSVFGDKALTRGILFCWGDTIYNPSATDIPGQLLAHEKVHSDRQLELGKIYDSEYGGDPMSEPELYRVGAEQWWIRYLEDSSFRLEEELLAHQVEYKYFSLDHPRNQRRLYLNAIAKRLSSSLYGNCVTFSKAKQLIKDL